jgi:hypothetical protein
MDHTNPKVQTTDVEDGSHKPRGIDYGEGGGPTKEDADYDE